MAQKEQEEDPLGFLHRELSKKPSTMEMKLSQQTKGMLNNTSAALKKFKTCILSPDITEEVDNSDEDMFELDKDDDSHCNSEIGSDLAEFFDAIGENNEVQKSYSHNMMMNLNNLERRLSTG